MKSKKLLVLVVGILVLCLLGGCANQSGKVKLDKENPVTINVWHYYNGSIMNAFDAQVKAFNETVGAEMGIIVEGHAYGGVSDLDEAVLNAAKETVGSNAMPNILAAYADTASQLDGMGKLANLDAYLTAEDQALYLPSYIDDGKIGSNGELLIFPIAKSTEIFMLNDTDWKPFAEANNLSYDDLNTREGIAKVAALYYDWTDQKTPDITNDGKAFYGRDSLANLFIIASKEAGVDLFKVEGGKATVQLDKAVMKQIWDHYYISYISGHFASIGRFRSDDAKVGDLLSYVGSTASAGYFPKEVIDSDTQPRAIECKVLLAPNYSNGAKIMVQQGAGMVVTKATPQAEYAAVEFLKWFTQDDINIMFSALSGYMPVKKAAIDMEVMQPVLIKNNIEMSVVTSDTLKTVFEQIKDSTLYTTKPFQSGSEARSALEQGFLTRCNAGREAVISMLAGGATLPDAIAQHGSDEQFEQWYNDFSAALNGIVK